MKSNLTLAGKRMVGICLLLMTALVAGCSSEPPSASGEAGGQKIKLIKGSYQWSSIGKHTIADAPSPDQIVEDTTAHIVKPNAELTIQFAGGKPDRVTAGLWEGHSSVDLPSKGEAFVLPSEPGAYVLIVWGEWTGDGRASYAAAIEVQE